MVVLHQVPAEPAPFDPSIPDDDLVIALPADATLERAGVDALIEFATDDRADAWFGDLVIAGRVHRRTAWSPTRLLTDPIAAAPLAVRAGWLRAHDTTAAAADLPFRLARERADVVHVTTVLTRHVTVPGRADAAVVAAHLAELAVPAVLDTQGRLQRNDDFAPEIDIIVPTAGTALDDGTIAAVRLRERLDPLPDRVGLVFVVGDEFRGDPAVLRAPGCRIVRRRPGPFNFSEAVNLGVLHAPSTHVLLLNDDTEPDGPAFVDQMALHLADSTVGAVGALLTYPDGTVQHAGLVIDDARPLHPFVGWSPSDTVPYGGLLAREVVAVTGACLMMRRADYLAVGGLSTSFPLSFNDVDLCLRVQRTIGRVVIDPGATLVHHETLTREPVISADEWDRWIDRWGEVVDPWYHPAYHRPDDPHDLARNANHLEPRPDDPERPPQARRPRLASRVHRGRPARGGG
jgi:GT2 family glycosyltransferase